MMRRKKMPDPFADYAWLAQAGWVYGMHSAQLWANPAQAHERLTELAWEKWQACMTGAFDASAAMMRGASPEAVAKAAMAPARRRVSANARKIGKG